jgi:nucleoid-associated protein YgaU
VGEALVSFLDEKGAPRPVERAFVVPPRSRLAPLGSDERAEVIRASPLRGRYDAAVDRESAYELLQKRAQAAAAAAPAPAPAGRARVEKSTAGVAGDMFGKMAQSAVRAAGTQIGREIMRGILGSMFGGGSRRRY